MSWSVAASRSASSAVHVATAVPPAMASISSSVHRVALRETHVLQPLVVRTRPPRDPEHHELAQPVSERGRIEQHVVVGEERPDERGVVQQCRQARSARAAASGPVARKRSTTRPSERRRAARRRRRRSSRSLGSGARRGARRRSQVPTAVDADQLAGDVARLVGAEERAGRGDVVGGACPAHRGAGGDGVDAREVTAPPRRGAPSACR